MEINLFLIIHRYNTLLLNYNIIIINTENHDVRTLVKIREQITKKLRKAFNFAQMVIAYAQDI